MLSVQGVEVDFDGQAALDGIDLEVADGEIVALLGPSGCGKTTLLRVIAGLEPVACGRVILDGLDLADVPTHRRGIGLMFQDYALFPHHDVAGNVAFGLRMRGDAAASRDARVAEVLELVGLAGFGRRSVATLSGGERQRVALARALAPSPALLMLDEPLGALDRTLRERLVLELSELFDRLAIAVIYVTHDQTEALALADRVVVMSGGRVSQQGTPDEVWAAPADAAVARFLGLSNIFEVDGAGDSRPATAPWLTGLVDGLPAGVPAPAGLAGQPVTVLVRPEAVHLAGRAGQGTVDATVEAVAFRGDHTQVWLTMPGGLRLEARLPGATRPDIGSTVQVGVDPDGVLRL